MNVDFNALTDCANCIQSQTDTNCIDIQYPSKVTQTFNARLHSTPLVHSTSHLLFLTFTTILVLLTSRTYVPFFCYKTTDVKQDDVHSFSQDVLQHVSRPKYGIHAHHILQREAPLQIRARPHVDELTERNTFKYEQSN